MSASREGRSAARRKRPPAAAGAAPGGRAATLTILSLVGVFLGTGLAVDSGTQGAFDAPKRLIAIAGAAAAFLFAWGFSRWEGGFAAAPRRLKWTALLALGACLWAVIAAAASPHRTVSLDAARGLLLMALYLPVGASRAVERRGGLLVLAFLAVAAINAVVSILQVRRLFQPFALVTVGTRDATGAFVGNVGYLALNLSLAAVAAAAVAFSAKRPSLRIAAVAAAVLFAGSLLVNRNLTSLTALATGWCVLSIAILRRRALLPIAALLVLLTAGLAVYRPMHRRVSEAREALRRREWDALVTYRLGPWMSALAMARDRPLTGWGPGTFSAEYIPHRLKVEIETGRRLTNPMLTSSYGEAHSDYLQAFAEAGLPAGIAAVAAAALLFGGLIRAVRRLSEPSRREAILLLALLCAGAAAALTWFPLQRPITAVPLLLAAGRAWRIASQPTEESPGGSA